MLIRGPSGFAWMTRAGFEGGDIRIVSVPGNPGRCWMLDGRWDISETMWDVLFPCTSRRQVLEKTKRYFITRCMGVLITTVVVMIMILLILQVLYIVVLLETGTLKTCGEIIQKFKKTKNETPNK